MEKPSCKPLKMLPLNQVVQGDCLTVMGECPEEAIDFVMFSPPYWGLRNYGESTETVWGGDPNCKHEWIEERMTLVHENRNFQKGTQEEVYGEKPTTYIKKYDDQVAGFCVKCGAWKGQLGLEPTWQLYVSHMVTVCQELKRVLKRTGSMYIVLGDTYAGSGQGHKISEQRETYKKYSKDLNFPYERPTVKVEGYQPKCLMGIPWRLAFALIDDGWVLRERIVWHKGNPMPGSQKDRLTQTCETIFHFVKNSGKALLWRNELTGEWLSQKPKQVYFHVETHALRQQCPPKEERYAFDEFGSRHLVWKPLWRGFDYYYELDAIREPHETSSLKRAGKTGVVPFNLRVRDAKRGKKGVFVEAGKVKELRASQAEVENYVYPESLTKHDVAVRRFPTVNREGGLGYTDPLHVKAYHEKGKNPGDTFQTRKKPYIGNNPHRMRLQNEQFLALDASRPMDLSHPKGKNPGDVVSERVKANLEHFVQRGSGGNYTYGGLDSEEGKHYAEKGKNPGDVLKFKGDETKPGGRLAKSREHYRSLGLPEGNIKGKNPGDFWTVCTKPFKGAHFAVYPEAICVNPILSSCPPNGTVLDPMCGSGTTCLVAKKLGRNYIGIEINSAYVEMARKRLSKIPEKLDKYVTLK